MNNDQIISKAIQILEDRIEYAAGPVMNCPEAVEQYLKLKLAEYEHEVFACVWLDNSHKIIKFEEMFRGTVNGASVYSREVVKAALACNAAAVILTHNHPSGVTDPSNADRHITKRLQEALTLVDVTVLDHIIVGESCTSLAQRGLI